MAIHTKHIKIKGLIIKKNKKLGKSIERIFASEARLPPLQGAVPLEVAEVVPLEVAEAVRLEVAEVALLEAVVAVVAAVVGDNYNL